MAVLRKIDHIGVIVEDLEEAISHYTSMGFERGPIQRLEGVGIEVTHVTMKDYKIELISYLGKGPSFGRDVMGDRLGLNHISFEVEDIGQAVTWMESKGNRLKEGFPTRGSEGIVAFFEPNPNDEVLIEVHESFHKDGSR